MAKKTGPKHEVIDKSGPTHVGYFDDKAAADAEAAKVETYARFDLHEHKKRKVSPPKPPKAPKAPK